MFPFMSVYTGFSVFCSPFSSIHCGIGSGSWLIHTGLGFVLRATTRNILCTQMQPSLTHLQLVVHLHDFGQVHFRSDPLEGRPG